MLIRPITLGGVEFPSNLIQAPLAGISCAPFRELLWQFGGLAYTSTEMISAKTLLGRSPKRYVYKNLSEGPLCFQLSGNNPMELQKAASIAVNHGANLIDLNCGCPVDKIRKKGCGSKLLGDGPRLFEIIRAIKASVDVPLSIKIRVDGDSGDRFNTDIVKIINDAGADFIVVHGRHWTEHYETAVRLDEIARIVEASNIPVIGNGDVKDYHSLTQMFKVTGCHGAMIGRASVGRPWLFKMLSFEDRGEPYAIPTKKDIGTLFLKHITGLIKLENETLAVLQARSLSKYYARAAGLCPSVYLQFNSISRFDELKSLVDLLFRES